MSRETIAKSLQSYASRIKAFILFMLIGICAGGVLSATSDDMLMFLAIFNNPHSAKKYMQAVKWMYIYLDCPLTWQSEKVSQCLRGAKKAALARGVQLRLAIRWDLLRSLGLLFSWGLLRGWGLRRSWGLLHRRGLLRSWYLLRTCGRLRS